MTKLQKIAKAVNDRYTDALAEEFSTEYGIEIVTEYNIFIMSHVSARKDGKRLTKSQQRFIHGFCVGYQKAAGMLA